jgi:exportin-T
MTCWHPKTHPDASPLRRNTKHKLDDADFATLREQFISYLRTEYLYGSAEANASYIRNKFSHTLTLLFLDTYESQWPSFFDDIFTLLKPPPETGVQPLNPHVSLFFFKLLMEMSSEIADQIMKNARLFSAERMARDGRIRDLVRERDAAKINQAVLTIVMDAKEKIDELRVNNVEDKSKLMEEVVDLGIRSFASYVREWCGTLLVAFEANVRGSLGGH